MQMRTNKNNLESAAKLLAVGLFCLLFCSLNCYAKTLAEYREGVKSAESSTLDLIDYVDEILDEGDKDVAYERELITEIRRKLPVTEKVEWEEEQVGFHDSARVRTPGSLPGLLGRSAGLSPGLSPSRAASICSMRKGL